ncbi:TPA: hypothetical protein EYP44_02065 [Candidatus Bathyarchaeota archaeon]|nr:hypothetical protein [Candidatus Bathyarchaeota archaeon]
MLVYATKKHGGEEDSLRDLWVLGLLSIAPYPLIDYLFEVELNLVTYLTDDPRIVVTPSTYLSTGFWVSCYSATATTARALTNSV